MNERRINSVMEAMKAQNLTQMLVTDSYAIDYLTGEMIQPGERFTALLLKTDGTVRLFLNRLFAAEKIPQEQIIFYTDEVRGAVLAAEYTDSHKTLGVDKKMAAEFLLELQEHHAGSSYVNASILVDSVRAKKDEEEQKLMEIASQINDRSMLQIKQLVKEGVTEKELSDELLKIYLKEGAEGFSFDAIVSFGEHAADPHHEPDDTVVKEGDCVLFDIGCRKDGYCSDMTRTFFFKSVGEKQREIYEIVRRANAAGEAVIRPGVRFCDIDAAARKVIEDAGYGPYFTHRLGHSIGKEVHEYGDVGMVNTNTVEEGMIFSCEPGIYLPGEFGVRIEDLCMVTKDGVKVLNSVSKELEIL
ncbi:MAG: M24 family metallopeptidase [Lachnospiraceae bacterium]